MEELGRRLRQAREAARLSIRQFALALDYSPSYLSDIENGRRGVTRPMCDQLSAQLGLDRVELYARAGHLTDSVLAYLNRNPKALRILELLAEGDAPAEVVEELCGAIRKKRESSPSSTTAAGCRLPDSEGSQ